MKRTISVPQVGDDNSDCSYSILVDYQQAIEAGAEKLGAVQVGRHYYYLAQEVDEIYRLTRMEVASLGAGDLDDRGSDYSLWCSTTGQLMRRPSAAVREALGVRP